MKRFTTRVAVTAFTLGLSLAMTGAAFAQPTAPAASGNSIAGKTAFMKYGCYECHGTRGQGNYMSGPHIAPRPIPQGALIAYIRKPGGQMPSYSATILPDKDAANIWAYLSSIPGGKPYAEIHSLSAITTKPK